MRAVRDVVDRDVVRRVAGEHRDPHPPRHLAVQAADAVARAAQPDRERRHAGRLARVVRAGAAQRHELVRRDAEPRGQVVVGREHLVDAVGLVPGRHGRVRREDEALAHGGERILERRAFRDRLRGELEPGECGMAFVQVADGRLDAERLQRADAADPEQRVLREPDRAIPLVEPRRRPAARRVVLGQLRVEQVERHAADVHPPDLEVGLAAEDVHGQPQRPAVGAGHARHRQALRIVLDPVLLLPPVQVEPLAEVAAPVEEADRNQRQGLVARLLEDVAGEHAEPARVDRQRGVDAVLRAEERDRPVDPRSRPRRSREVGVHLRGERQCAVADRRIARRALLRGRPEVAQEPHRVLVGELPAVRVDVAEEGGAVAGPRPAVVVGDSRERTQGLGQPLGEALRPRGEISASVGRGHDLGAYDAPPLIGAEDYRRVSRRAAAGRRG